MTKKAGRATVVEPEPEAGPEKINPQLAPLVRSIEGLTEDPNNARLHPERNSNAIAFSAATFRQQKPIVAMRDGRVIAGNGFLRAAISLGWTRIAVVEYDSEDEAEAQAFALADNRTAELATWDFGVLDGQLSEMESQFDLPALGFLPDDWKKQAPDLNVLSSFSGHMEKQHTGGAITFTFDTTEEVDAVMAAIKAESKEEIGARLVALCKEVTGS